MKKKKFRLHWTCSDFKHHYHRYKLAADLCGRIQYYCAVIKNNIKYYWYYMWYYVWQK